MYAGARDCLASNLLRVRFPPSPLNFGGAGEWDRRSPVWLEPCVRDFDSSHLHFRAGGLTGRHLYRTQEIGVRLPAGPLVNTPMVKRTSYLASNETVQVRLLVGVLSGSPVV